MRKRLILLLLTLLWPSFAHAQGTLSPVAQQVFLDSSGNPINNGKICTYAAGTTTPQATYFNADLDVSHVNANPIRTNSAGRPTTGGVYLSPTSYKFVVLTAGTDGTCSTGTTIYTQDNISAVPATAVGLDVTGTAGEAISAGDVVYLSDGSGSKTAGRWYKADADTTYSSSTAGIVGIAPSAVASAATGSFRIGGRITGLSGLTAGANYYASATAGALTATQPTNARFMGAADTTTSLLIGTRLVPAPRGPPNGRLTLESGVCVSSTDQTAKTSLYYTPCGGGNAIDLYDGSQWVSYAFAEISIAVPSTTVTMYDVFAYANAGVVTLELTAWTNDTTRATALTTQNGVYVKSGALTRRYLGSFRTTGVSGQTEDSLAKRYVWNYYNRLLRPMRVLTATASWTYTTDTLRQVNASAANQIDIVVGVAEVLLTVTATAHGQNTSAGVQLTTAIGAGSTSAVATGSTVAHVATPVANYYVMMVAELRTMPAIGRQFYAWLERSGATGTTTWVGFTAGEVQSGLLGTIEG